MFFEYGSPILETREQGKTIYQNIMVISVLVSAFVFPFVGRICDYYSPRYTIPFAFLFRAATTIIFYFVVTPDGTLAYVSSIMMIIATIVENISVDTIFA